MKYKWLSVSLDFEIFELISAFLPPVRNLKQPKMLTRAAHKVSQKSDLRWQRLDIACRERIIFHTF